MLDARALAIGWISTALLLAAGLAYGMHTAAGIALDRGFVDASNAPGIYYVMSAKAAPMDVPAALHGGAHDTKLRC